MFTQIIYRKRCLIFEGEGLKVFEPTPFRAAALNSFFEVAESAKEKEKIYYSHLGIEVRKDQLKDSSVSNAQYG